MKKIIQKTVLSFFVFAMFFVVGFSKASAQPAPIPTISSVNATQITQNTARLNASVNPRGYTTYAWFEVWQLPGQQFGFQNMGNYTYTRTMNPYTLGFLNPNTTYTFRVVAQNAYGWNTSNWFSFTTLQQASAPSVISAYATNINQNTATLNGIVNPNGAFTNAWYERLNANGTTTKIPIAGIDIPAGNSNVNLVPWNVSNLTAGQTYTFRVVARNTHGTNYGNWTSFVTLLPATPQPSVTLSANPTNIPFGGNTTLVWNVTNATSCNATGGWSGSKSVNGGSQTISGLTQTTTFNITCVNGSNSANSSVTVSVLPQQTPAPTLNIFANPNSVNAGGSSTISWNTTNAINCNASGGANGWAGSKPTNGSFHTGILNQTTTYTLTCNGLGGSTAQSVTVNINQVTPAPTVNITASPTSVNSGGSSTISWNTTNAINCNASGGANGWAGFRSTSGVFNTGALTQTTTYTLNCAGAGGSTAQSVTVSVNQPQNPIPTLTLSAVQYTIPYNASTMLYWYSANATSCNASGGVPGWEGSRNLMGTWTTPNLTQTTNFTMTCQGQGGLVTKSVTINVQ